MITTSPSLTYVRHPGCDPLSVDMPSAASSWTKINVSIFFKVYQRHTERQSTDKFESDDDDDDSSSRWCDCSTMTKSVRFQLDSSIGQRHFNICRGGVIILLANNWGGGRWKGLLW